MYIVFLLIRSSYKLIHVYSTPEDHTNVIITAYILVIKSFIRYTSINKE